MVERCEECFCSQIKVQKLKELVIQYLTIPKPPTLYIYGCCDKCRKSVLNGLYGKTGIIPLLVDFYEVQYLSTLQSAADGIATQMIASANDQGIHFPDYDDKFFAKDPFSRLGKWFKAIERAFPAERFLLFLDEFDRLNGVDAVCNHLSGSQLTFFKNLHQGKSKQWTVLFSSAYSPKQLKQCIYDFNDLLIGCKRISLKYLKDEV
jgi:hypothetical protein